VLGAIGNTPLVRIASLSRATGCEVTFARSHSHATLQKRVAPDSAAVAAQIYAKVEFANPGGSVKDRVAVRIIQACSLSESVNARRLVCADTRTVCHHTLSQEALASGALRPGGLVTEGTAGSTGISLAMVAPAFGAAPPRAPVRTHVQRQCFAQLSHEAGCLAACAVVQRSHVWCAAVALRCVLARRLPLPRGHAGRRCGGEGGHHPRAGRDCAARAPGVNHAPGALCERGAPSRRGAACVACTQACAPAP
jgi:hypothetical protein